MITSKSWPHEHILAATIEYECKIRGAQRMAFPSVVGGGNNGTIIHYSRNDQQIQEGDMVLVDAGCEFYGYASDITRTWPPCGKFYPAQRDIYEAVLQASQECLSLCRPGITLNEIHDHSVRILSENIRKLGLFKDVQLNYAMLNPTSIGHYLGMDVHDCSSISKSQPLQPGVVITIEPGLYIPTQDNIPNKYRGIGVRIEDEVLITECGCEVLTTSIPKEVEEIEARLQKSTTQVHPLARVPRIKAPSRL
ncbi:hypothetical protein O6H91_07G009400 [Diphasiastrum complanatum]|uniref:Uncharacterized protein n=1 Tax=Diphasiastrum complanatum TaxID=34168 RepID=A0ACC2D293_DIPCM|nr:hypothetical protein O6H91_07G009400 [Diphasiastrum complanatum]